MLTKEQILEVDDLPTEEVDVPEWGGTVRVRGLTGEGRNEYESSLSIQLGDKTVPHLKNYTAKLVARAVVDDAGELMFTPKEAIALGKKSGLALERIAKVVRRISGLDDDSEKEIEGNSDAAQSGASTSSEPTQPESQ